MAVYKKVDANRLDADLTAVADAIREKTGSTELLSFPDGMAAEVDAVYEAGKQAEYSKFWDAYQENGNRTNYMNAFAGNGWTKETFVPKYDITPVNAFQIFGRGSFPGDLVEHLKSIGKNLDFSKTITFSEAFLETNVTRGGIIDTRSANYVTYIFSNL